jgi:hypothetical protein
MTHKFFSRSLWDSIDRIAEISGIERVTTEAFHPEDEMVIF